MVFPHLLPEGGDAALKEFKAIVEREAKGFRLGAEVGVKCTGGETGLFARPSTPMPPNPPVRKPRPAASIRRSRALEVEPLGRAMRADSKMK